MTDHVTTVEEVLYYADFWLSLSEKALCLSNSGTSTGEAEVIALLAVKLAYDRYRTALEDYTQTTNPPENVGALAAQLQAEVDAMMETKL